MSLVRQLLDADLLDELRLFVHKDLIHLSLSGSRLASDWLLAELGPIENRR